MRKEIKINRLQILIIVIVLILIESFVILNCLTDINQTLDIFTKSITKQIDIDKEISENEKLLGITDVQGEGIIISILDGGDIIHQEDVTIVLNELKNSGAQALAVNDVRITNSTYLYCDGTVILIDGEKIGNPFTIKAIGDSETMYGALTRNKGYLDTLKNDRIEIDVQKSDNIQIGKTKKASLLNYAQNKNKIDVLKESNQLTGKSAVQGEGLQILIEENSTRLTALSFIQIVNDLRTGGAKAISINGNRITYATDIIDINKKYTLVNSTPISAPYLIEAVGNQDSLRENITYKSSYLNKIDALGDNIEIYRSPRVKIDGYVQKRDKNKMATDYL